MLGYLSDCAAWGLLQPHELQRLVDEGGVDGEVAMAVQSAVQALDNITSAMGAVKAVLPPTFEYHQIKVSWVWGTTE